jgi:hypothetical protein
MRAPVLLVQVRIRRELRVALQRPAWIPAVHVDPGGDVDGIEAQEVTPFDVRDASFVDEASHVSDLDTERCGDLNDGEEPTHRRLRVFR